VIVTKTPLRIPLAGGLTDIRPFAERFGGVTVSAAIDRFVYVVLKPNPGGIFELRYQDTQEKAPDGRRYVSKPRASRSCIAACADASEKYP